MLSSTLWIPAVLFYTNVVTCAPIGSKDPIASYPFCKQCLSFTQVLENAVRYKQTYDNIRPVLIGVCEGILFAAHYHGDVICPGLIDTYGPPSLGIVAQAYFTPDLLCEKLEFCPKKPGIYINDEAQCMDDMEETNINDVESNTNTDMQNSENQSSPIRILHLTDIHLDHEYVEGTPTDCGMFICCRKDVTGSGKAGHYGSYNCDLPVVTLRFLTEHLRQLDPQPDFVVYTGDNPTHKIWNKTWQGQLASTDFIVDFLSTNLPNLTIYPTLGNHEAFPDNLYYPPTYANFTAAIADFWNRWVAFPEDASETIRAGGYYSVLIQPGLRLLSINTDFLYQLNFYTLLNDRMTQYFEQFRWIERTLEAAAKNGEKVIIIGHISPGRLTAIESYGDFYVPVVSRYRDIIVGQFFGHDHRDGFEVVRPHTNSNPTGVVYIAPSMTPYPNINPSYRIYVMDPNTYNVIDYEQYHLNLPEANFLAMQNRSEEITWKLAYTAKNEYDLVDLTPASWWKLTEEFQQDDELFSKYWDNMQTQSSPPNECNQLCKHAVICRARSASKQQLLKCLITV